MGTALVSTLAVAPAFAAAPVSQATARSINLKIAGNDVISQNTSAVNDGSTQAVVDDNTIPHLVSLIPGNNALSLGVGVQKAQANNDGTSFACAGVAGTGGGLATIGSSECKIDSAPLTLGLGGLNLDLAHLLGGDGAITSALNGVLGPVLIGPLASSLTPVLTQFTDALAGAGLDIGLTGGLSVIEATCTADPQAAHGVSNILDTAGGHTIPIRATVGDQTVTLANLNVNVAPKPGGTDILVHADALTQAIIDALSDEITTVIQGQLAGLDSTLKPVLQGLQNQLIAPLVNALEPALQGLSDNILKVVVNDVTPGDGGRSVTVNTLKLDVLGLTQPFTGSSLIGGTIGHVTCGPNRAPEVTPPSTTPESPQNPAGPEVPTVVSSGVAGHGDHTARNVLLATGALMLLAGSAGLAGFRRSLLNK